MTRITLAMVAIAVSAVVEAQIPPTPPAPRPAPVAPRAEGRPQTPPTPPTPRPDFFWDWDREWARQTAEQARHAAEIARETIRFDAEHIREQARQAAEMAREASRIDAEAIREQARHAVEMAREARIHFEDMRIDVPRAFERGEPFFYTPRPLAAPIAPTPVIPPMSFGFESDRLPTRPPAAWAQGDPADSLYRLASESSNRGDYRRAAQLFSELSQKFPNSRYLGDAMYWEAFARYRLGSTDELERAAKALEALSARGNDVRRRGQDGDVDALRVRVYGELGRRGVRGYDDKLKSIAPSGACDREDVSVRAEALNALGRMDAAASMPYIRRVLNSRDECSADLRQKAVFMLGQRGDQEATSTLITVAKSDPSQNVRIDAITWLPRLPGDAPFSALEDILRGDTATRIQRAAVRALNSSDNPKARQSIRALIDRRDAAEPLRIEAINSFDKERATDDDARYLRSLYARAETDRMREAIINAVGRLGGQENDQFVVSLARNPNTPDQLRSIAVSRLGRMTTISIGDLVKLYDVAETRSMRDQLINVFATRKEQEATDKLFQIARTSTTDPIAKRNALNALVRKGNNDPKVMQLMFDIIEKKP